MGWIEYPHVFDGVNVENMGQFKRPLSEPPHRQSCLTLWTPMTRLKNLLFLLAFFPALAWAQRPIIDSVDPPNWYASLPRPMLLLHGQNLTGSSFSLSDASLRLERTKISVNGHWAQLWLAASPAQPEAVTIYAHNSAGSATVSYTFQLRRPVAEGAAGFSPADVLYLIMPDRFADGDRTNNALPSRPAADRSQPRRYHGGDLQGILDHLDYLQQLGVTALWLTPIVQNDPQASDYHGYGATNLYEVEPRLGTLAAYKHLADELHRRHMKLVFDDVPNHVGPRHPWVTDPPEPDWFHGTLAQHLDNEYNFVPISDPHAAPRAADDALDGWFANILADLNQANPAVQQYLTDNMIWWIEQVGIDGLRIDTFQYVQREFWQKYLATLNNLYPHLTEVGEITSPEPSVTAFYAGGRSVNGVDTHLTTPFDYPTWFTLVDVLAKGKPMSALEELLRQDWLYPHSEVLVPFLSNHDQRRFLSQPGVTPARMRLALGLLMTMRGTPQLYAGDEVLMQGDGDPDNRRDFPGGFPGDAQNAFTAAGRTPAQNAIHDWVAALGALRARSPAMQTGAMQTLLAGDSTFAYVRMQAGSSLACSQEIPRNRSLLVALNRSEQAATITIPIGATALQGCRSAKLQLGDDATHSAQALTGDTVTIHLPSNGFAVYELQ